MNERIFELIQQQNGNCGLGWSEEDKEKFAELIVQECVEVCNGQATYDPQTLPYKPSKQFADAIKEHFGVKE